MASSSSTIPLDGNGKGLDPVQPLDKLPSARPQLRLTLPIIFLSLALLGGFGFFVYRGQYNQARDEARIIAEAIQRQIAADRFYYTDKVVSTALANGLEVTNHYDDAESGAIPLPATYVREVAETLNQSASSTEYQLRLLSLFPVNPEQGPRSDAEEALMQTNFDNRESVDQITTVDGSQVYTLYEPDIGSAESCVSCHNALEDSPKRDYQVRDVMGSLVVTIPMGERLNQAVARTVVPVVLFTTALVGVVGALVYFLV